MRAVSNHTQLVRCKFLGCPLDNLAPEQILCRIREAIGGGVAVRVEGLNAAKIVQARRNQALMAALEEAEIVHVDGVGVALGGRILGYRLPARCGGCDLMLDLLRQAAQEGHRLYFLGATQEVISEMLHQLLGRFPTLNVVGARNGYFGTADEGAIVDDIRSKNVDILFVGISSPKKELFVSRVWSSLGVKVSMGVGGAFDVFSAKVKRAPPLVQRVGLEWLFRLCQEPRRLAYRYLSTNAIFATLLLRQAFGLGTDDSGRKSDSGPRRHQAT